MSRSSNALTPAQATKGGIEFEKRYGRERWRNISITSLCPVVKPPMAPPNAFPKVPVIISIFPKQSNNSETPLPVLPTTPAEWLSSTATIASYFSASSIILSIGATLPSIEKTPSVIIIRNRCSCASIRHFSSSSISAFA